MMSEEFATGYRTGRAGAITEFQHEIEELNKTIVDLQEKINQLENQVGLLGTDSLTLSLLSEL